MGNQRSVDQEQGAMEDPTAWTNQLSHTSEDSNEDISDEAWTKLFQRLTGGNEEAQILSNTPKTNLGPRRVSSKPEMAREGTGLLSAGTSLLAPPANTVSTTPRGSVLSIFTPTPLPDIKERTIDLDTLEKFIMGVKESYTLEIEYGIPRSQLRRAVRSMKAADKDNNGEIGRCQLTTIT